LASPPRLKRAILRDVSVRFAPLPPVWRDGRVRLKALAPKARAPSGAAGSNPRSLRQDVHVRQIRLAAAVRKTATQSGKGGSSPLTCTRAFRVSRIWGGEAAHLAALIRQSSHVQIVPPERLRRLMIGRLPVEEYGASLNLVVAARFRRCTLGWFGGCSFKALIRGFDSRHRRQNCCSLLMRTFGRSYVLSAGVGNNCEMAVDLRSRSGVSCKCNDESGQSRLYTSDRATAAWRTYVIARRIP
jgi:hypothetical protein